MYDTVEYLCRNELQYFTCINGKYSQSKQLT